MESFSVLKNIKEHIHEYYGKTVIHPSINMPLTVQTMSQKAYDELNDITSPNPFKEGFIALNKPEEEIECNVIYMAYGIKEFEGNKELARDYLEEAGMGEGNAVILNEIKTINISFEERVKDIILILAFSHRELRLIQSALEANCKKELAQYVSGINNGIEALYFCQELFDGYLSIFALSAEHKITIEYSALILAKNIFDERGYVLPDKLEAIEMPGKTESAPSLNVHLEQ